MTNWKSSALKSDRANATPSVLITCFIALKREKVHTQELRINVFDKLVQFLIRLNIIPIQVKKNRSLKFYLFSWKIFVSVLLCSGTSATVFGLCLLVYPFDVYFGRETVSQNGCLLDFLDSYIMFFIQCSLQSLDTLCPKYPT